MTTNKGDFIETVTTQQKGRKINVSFTDTIEVLPLPVTQYGNAPQEQLLLQIGREGAYECTYLGRIEVDRLILALQQARSIWFAKWEGK